MLGQLLQDAPSSTVLSIFPLAFLAAPGHLGLVAHLPGWTHLDGSVLQCCSLQSHPVATLEQQLHHLSVNKSLY